MKRDPLPKTATAATRPTASRRARHAPKPAKHAVRSFAQLRSARSADERHELVVNVAIPSKVVVQASEALGVPQAKIIDALGLNEATFYRWLQKGQPIAAEKNEQVVRLAEFAELAARAFGDEEKGKRWLTRPNAALGGATPLSMLESSYAAERVRQALSVIEHGGVA